MAVIAEVRSRGLRVPMILLVAGLLGLVVAMFAAALLYARLPRGLVGTDLGKTPAPPFTLTDHDGQQVSLEQFRGQPVALTFLYTHCPDACPLIADQLRQATDQLGADAGRVAVLAVSTDPLHDDRAAAISFTQTHGMEGRWRYLLGSPAQLSPVWKAYYIGVTPGNEAAGPLGENGITHSDAVFLIDKAGRERALLGVPFSARDLVSDLRTLLAES